MSSISLEGLSGVAGDERSLAILKVSHNDQEYDWSVYIPANADLSTYLSSIESQVYSDIDSKEAQWEALSPKTREYTDPFTNNIETVEILKGEIVRPDIPDYYALRRVEYPSLGDQLDAMWKGGSAASDMQAKITAIKTKYPKP